jgi:hypothetical protein
LGRAVLPGWRQSRADRLRSRASRVRVYKETKHSRRRIEAAVAAIVAFSVAAQVDRGPQLWSFADAA